MVVLEGQIYGGAFPKSSGWRGTRTGPESAIQHSGDGATKRKPRRISGGFAKVWSPNPPPSPKEEGGEIPPQAGGIYGGLPGGRVGLKDPPSGLHAVPPGRGREEGLG